MLLELITKIIHCDAILTRLDSISKECLSKIINLVLIKLHPILCHTRLDNLPQLCLVNLSITWWEGERKMFFIFCYLPLGSYTLNKKESFSSSPWFANWCIVSRNSSRETVPLPSLSKIRKAPSTKNF